MTSKLTTQSSSRIKTVNVNEKRGHRRNLSPHLKDALSTASKSAIFFIRGYVERRSFEETPTIMLGRFEETSSPQTIDLTQYWGVESGVSRVHCHVTLEDDTLYISDLDSKNGTFISGERLTPNVPYPLKRGDEFYVGRLSIRIVYTV